MRFYGREVFYLYSAASDRVDGLIETGFKVTWYRDKLDGKVCWIVEWE